MFSKTRVNIVVTVVISLVSLMAVTLATIYISNRIFLQRENKEMLRTYVERFSLEAQPPAQEAGAEGKKADDPSGGPAEWPGEGPAEEPGEGPADAQGNRQNGPGQHGAEPGREENRFQLSTFYSAAYSDTGEVLSVNNGNNTLQSEESLLALTSSILKSGRRDGRTGNMTYLVEKREGYTLVALIDGTINSNNQMALFRQMVVIGSVSLIILIIISIFLSRRIVRPLEENDKKQKRFISDAGHELKTPIAVISANSEVLRREAGDSEWLGNIEYENERMSDLVKQLLALSKAENGGAAKETLDFSKLVDGEVLPFETLAFEKGKRISSEIEPGIQVEGDRNQLRQLVSILLDNALCHGTGDNIALKLCREKHNAVITVVNDAEEISSEQLAHLFDRFYRADESRNSAEPHYGLGLSIAHAVSRAHGGSIRAEYKNGKAKFTAVLPSKK